MFPQGEPGWAQGGAKWTIVGSRQAIVGGTPGMPIWIKVVPSRCKYIQWYCGVNRAVRGAKWTIVGSRQAIVGGKQALWDANLDNGAAK